jgi:hypothetical protein
MNYLKTNPLGIDLRIGQIQTFLYNNLKTTWGLNDSSFNMFGRAYRNQTADGYIPEVFMGTDYRDTFYDDKVAATCFFGVKETVKVEEKGYNTAEVFAIFMVNLNKIKTQGKRMDEEAKLDVELLVNKDPYGFLPQGTMTGIESVFSEYSGWKKTDGMKFRDTQPFYCFRINFRLMYKINNKCGS